MRYYIYSHFDFQFERKFSSGAVHTYSHTDNFESATFSFRIQKISLSTRSVLQSKSTPTCCAAILVYWSVRDWARFGYIIGFESLRINFFFFHSGDRIQKYPDSLLSSPNGCGLKPYREKNISRHMWTAPSFLVCLLNTSCSLVGT